MDGLSCFVLGLTYYVVPFGHLCTIENFYSIYILDLLRAIPLHVGTLYRMSSINELGKAYALVLILEAAESLKSG